MNPYDLERLDGWIGDFAETTSFAALPAAAKAHADAVVREAIVRACAVRDVELGDIEEADLRSALVDRVSRLDLPDTAHDAVPDTVAAFLEEMERAGRIGGGASLGRFVRALRGAYRTASRGPAPIRRPGSKLGRNDPCPCGSGKKYKKCCAGESLSG